VVEAAAELLLHQFFGASYDVRAVTAFAADLHEATAARPRPLPQLKTEAVIRSTLGESDVVTSDIKSTEKFRIRMAAMALITGKRQTDEADLDPILVEAERIAFERGWNPPLADE
jgi:hypothetical protein